MMGWFGMPGHTRDSAFKELFSQSQYEKKFELLWQKGMKSKCVAVFSLDGKIRGETILWNDAGGELAYKSVSWVEMVKYIPQKWLKKLLETATDAEKECYQKTIKFRLQNEEERKIMKINEITNLFVGRNETENFTVLIVALDAQEASDIAREYALESKLEGEFDIKEFTDIDTHFDCDYVLTGGQ